MEKDTDTEKPQKGVLGEDVNDFCMTICTVNGSGSATANTTLLKAIFHMGIPIGFPFEYPKMVTWLVWHMMTSLCR